MEKVLIMPTIKSDSISDQSAKFHENNLKITKEKESEEIKQEDYMQKKQ